MVRHKVFLSFHKDDLDEVRAFIDRFDTGEDAFIYRAITMDDDVINSNDPDYVMSCIRRDFLADSTVTMVLIGACTWARKFVDWELQSSLRRPALGKPNGLVGILLDPAKTVAVLPERLKLNVESGYAEFLAYPTSGRELSESIERAFLARDSKQSRIVNPRERRRHNGSCLFGRSR